MEFRSDSTPESLRMAHGPKLLQALEDTGAVIRDDPNASRLHLRKRMVERIHSGPHNMSPDTKPGAQVGATDRYWQMQPKLTEAINLYLVHSTLELANELTSDVLTEGEAEDEDEDERRQKWLGELCFYLHTESWARVGMSSFVDGETNDVFDIESVEFGISTESEIDPTSTIDVTLMRKLLVSRQSYGVSTRDSGLSVVELDGVLEDVSAIELPASGFEDDDPDFAALVADFDELEVVSLDGDAGLGPTSPVDLMSHEGLELVASALQRRRDELRDIAA